MLRIETVFAGLEMDMIRSCRPRSNALRSEAAASFRQADITAHVAYFRVAIRLIPQGTTTAHIPFQIKVRGIAILLSSGIGQDLCSWAFGPGVNVCFIWPRILSIGELAFQKMGVRLLSIQAQPDQFI